LWLVLMGKGLRPSSPTVSGLDYEHFVFAGAIAMAVLFSGMFQSVSIIWDREFGSLKEVTGRTDLARHHRAREDPLWHHGYVRACRHHDRIRGRSSRSGSTRGI